jgi:hypothetical protein
MPPFSIFTKHLVFPSISPHVVEILFAISYPFTILPIIVYLLSRKGRSSRVMKNWLPLVFFPLFDKANNPGSQNFKSGMISSSKYSLLKTDK